VYAKMIAKIFRIFSQLSPGLKTLLWKQWYQILASLYQKSDWKFMNYGYAPINNQSDKIYLNETDEDNRYCIQLYHYKASSINLKDLNVLEVGSGRGGGADYIKRYHKPKKMVGVDYCANAIRFCNRNYMVNGLSFEKGNAELLPFPDNSFDVVINVESSHCYGSMGAFLVQVNKVLRKGGYFLFVDFRSKDKIALLRETLCKSGLKLIDETDITPNIVEALELDDVRKTTLIKQAVFKPLVRTFLEFAGVKGSAMYNEFKNGETVYQSFVFQKAD
jgi:ubiquinone/menaquinone biosynthesis C-methylase UbiE